MWTLLKRFLNIINLDVDYYILKILQKIGESYKIQKSLLKQELEHDEIYEDN